MFTGGAEDNPYEARPCPVCHKSISNTANLKKHLKIRHSEQEEATCPHCRKPFRNKYSLWTHLNSYHPQAKQKSYPGKLVLMQPAQATTPEDDMVQRPPSEDQQMWKSSHMSSTPTNVSYSSTSEQSKRNRSDTSQTSQHYNSQSAASAAKRPHPSRSKSAGSDYNPHQISKTDKVMNRSSHVLSTSARSSASRSITGTDEDMF